MNQKRLTFLLVIFISVTVFAQHKDYMLTGSYTKGQSKGIYVYTFNTSNGTADLIDSAVTSNPSYLAVSPDRKYVYAVNENNAPDGNGGEVSSFAFDAKTGHLQFLNKVPSYGNDPCYVSVDKTGKWVIIGNYSSGTITVYQTNKDGSLGKVTDTLRHTGHGVNKDHQESAHVHSTVLSKDNRFVFVPDLGIDKVTIYTFNNKTGHLAPAEQPYVKLKDGSGPRHFDFHPSGKWAYLAQEMGGTVTAFRYNNGRLTVMQTLSTLPADYKGDATTADIHVSPDGKFVYVSNRDQSNTIAIFRINQQTGKLTLVGHQSTLGRTPRNFNFDPTGNYLIVANQNSDNIFIFKVDHKTGKLTPTGTEIKTGNPVCIKWIVERSEK